MARLEQWSVINGDSDPYLPPEMLTSHLRGNIYDDERFEDGMPITTSPLVSFPEPNVAQTRNTRYDLGEPEAKFVQFLKEKGQDLNQFWKEL